MAAPGSLFGRQPHNRRSLWSGAVIDLQLKPARIDEDGLRESLTAEGATPHDIVYQTPTIFTNLSFLLAEDGSMQRIEIPDDAAETILTVGDAVGFLKKESSDG